MESMNISLIAEKAGVSRTSVSNYLNNRKGKLSAETSERIAKVIKECNYIPSFSARRLRSSVPSKTVGIVITDLMLQSIFTVPLYGYMMKGIGNVLLKSGYSPLIITGHKHGATSSIDYLKELSRSFVDGYILFNVRSDDDYAAAFKKSGIPFICMGYAPEFGNYVGTDYYAGAKDAVEYLIQHGCRRIAISSGERKSIVSKQLIQGYSEVLSNHGIAFDESIVFHDKSDIEESIFDELIALYQQPDRPDGFILSEAHFHDLQRVAEAIGFPMKECVKTVVYTGRILQDIDTYLEIPFEDIGEAAAANLLSQLTGKSIQPILFRPRLVMRKGFDS